MRQKSSREILLIVSVMLFLSCGKSIDLNTAGADGNVQRGDIRNSKSLLFEPEENLKVENEPLKIERLSPHLAVNPSYGSPMSVRMSASAPQNSTVRKRRYDYEDTHEWPPGDSLEYDFDDDDQKEELTFWQEVGRNWQVVFIRAIFLICFLGIIMACCCFCCYVNCRICCDSLTRAVTPWRPVFEYLSQCYEDPMYAKARDLAEILGIKLDYKTYMKIKETHEFGGRAGFNPLNLQ
ncbi:hypothetical protein PoB_000142900 [Plakobranchus ocellatus]|uniref:Uncharacterized protein n=1 Tax=Plakobranchus ocellatus TaxID=259542 RepID=A0AAV3XVM3_9GAST|nr:hypothetical protein PoB_000142900 [Plakobranchus ocellatus]